MEKRRAGDHSTNTAQTGTAASQVREWGGEELRGRESGFTATTRQPTAEIEE